MLAILGSARSPSALAFVLCAFVRQRRVFGVALMTMHRLALRDGRRWWTVIRRPTHGSASLDIFQGRPFASCEHDSVTRLVPLLALHAFVASFL